MFDEVNEIVAQPAVAEQEAPEAAPQEQAHIDPKQEQKERNLTAMRERLESERQAREHAQRRLKELEERLAQQEQQVHPQYAPQSAPADDTDIPDDEIVDGRTYKTRIKKIEQRFEDKIKQLEERTRFESAERAMRERYPDFGQVVTESNLRNFQQLYPEEYTSMMMNPDPYARMKTAYTSMVNFGVTEQAKTPAYTQGKPVNRAQAPKSAAAAPTASQSPTTPLSYVADMEGRRVLTEEMKLELRRKIQRDKELLASMGR